jgi:hypothetical protein
MQIFLYKVILIFPPVEFAAKIFITSLLKTSPTKFETLYNKHGQRPARGPHAARQAL